MENQSAIISSYVDGQNPSLESNIRGRVDGDQQEYQEVLITVPPDGGWGWMVVIGAFFSFLIVDGMFYSFGVFLETMSKDLNCSKTKVSMSAAITAGVFCLSGPFTASLVNKYGYRSVGIAGSMLSIISCLLSSVAKSIYLIYFIYGVMAGIGFGLIYMPAVIAVGFYFERWRGIATGIASCGAGLGGVVLPFMFSMTLDGMGWRQTFRLLSALFLLTLMCALLFRPVPPSKVQMVKLNPVVSGNFFTTYHNRMYPTLSELTEVPTIILLQPRRFKSSEVMITSYPSSSLHFKSKDEEAIAEAVAEESRTELEYQSSRNKSDNNVLSDEEIIAETVAEESRTELEYQSSRNKKDNNGLSEKITGTLFPSKNRVVHRMRPMYRDDIFYNSSFNFLQKYKKTERRSSVKTPVAVSKSNMEYHMSVTRLATQRDLNETGCRRALCTEAVKRTLATMLDYKLLKSPSFLLIALNATFVCLGYFTTYIFIEDRALQSGLSRDLASWLVPIIGIANIVGRIICGLVATCPKVSCTWLSATCLTLGGFATILSVHFNQIAAQFCYAVLFGGFIACIPVLRTLIIVDTLGLEKLTNAVGLILMFQGVACLLGLSIAGVLREATGDYRWSFYFSGATIILAALFFIPLQKVAVWEQTRGEKMKQNQR